MLLRETAKISDKFRQKIRIESFYKSPIKFSEAVKLQNLAQKFLYS